MSTVEPASGRSPDASPPEKANQKMIVPPGFSPEGLKVLVVDDDPVCLRTLEVMLKNCSYTVTACQRAQVAWELLLANRNAFDIVISDVYMPGVDGFKLLQDIGLELDLPVIMMSANGETDVVLKGITNGACGYLIKPVRMEELRTIWQHVLRRRGRTDCVKDELTGDGSESGRRTDREGEENSKKRRHESGLEDVSGLKKSRVNWSPELHQQFVHAVNQLGIDKAVPKRILELMNVQGLSRENVASHLQKYRQYLKRTNGVNHQQHPVVALYPSGNFGGGLMQLQQCFSPDGGNNLRLTGSSIGSLDHMDASPMLSSGSPFLGHQIDSSSWDGMGMHVSNNDGLAQLDVARLAELQNHPIDADAWLTDRINMSMIGSNVGGLPQIDESPWLGGSSDLPALDSNVQGPNSTVRAPYFDAVAKLDEGLGPWSGERMNVPAAVSNARLEHLDSKFLLSQFSARSFEPASIYCEGVNFRQDPRLPVAEQGVYCAPCGPF